MSREFSSRVISLKEGSASVHLENQVQAVLQNRSTAELYASFEWCTPEHTGRLIPVEDESPEVIPMQIVVNGFVQAEANNPA